MQPHQKESTILPLHHVDCCKLEWEFFFYSLICIFGAKGVEWMGFDLATTNNQIKSHNHYAKTSFLMQNCIQLLLLLFIICRCKRAKDQFAMRACKAKVVWC